MQYELRVELLKKHDIENDLLDVNRIRSRARTLEVLYYFGEEVNEVYLYDFIAYLFNSSNKVEDSCYEEYIMNLLVNMNDDVFVFSKEEFEEFMIYSKDLTISSELKSMFCCMYIYNEVYIENKYLMESPIYDLSDVEVLELMNINNLLKKEINYLKKSLVKVKGNSKKLQ